jgi:hypothetical protein
VGDHRRQALEACLRRFGRQVAGLDEIQQRVDRLPDVCADTAQDWIELYHACYAPIERALWETTADFDELLEHYQALFREQDQLIGEFMQHSQYEFLIAIPVADRPRHLRDCLESIYQNAQLFGYGSNSGDHFDRFRVIIAEDSRQPQHVQAHIELAREFSARGLWTYHLGFDEQYRLLQSIPEDLREQLGDLLTRQPAQRFFLKGQAANRNLAYLKFLELTHDRTNTLYYLVDSDQYFKVPRPLDGQPAYALNYFYYINRIFREGGVHMLTGKLVGDPPVSPSVMAANFMSDVTAFFEQLTGLPPTAPCSFHRDDRAPVDDAAYHDMADFFGFRQRQEHFEYPCPIKDAHDHRDCLERFSERLNAFFFGEHLTRKTSFVYTGDFSQRTPARTVYPGNYIVDFAGLKYIIPFGHLRLRMSGPTAGRLIQAEIGEAFVSANLPMLHGRTTEGGPTDDFRPGVEAEDSTIDLSDEYERQFFGDLMLFSVAELTHSHSAPSAFDERLIDETLQRIEHKLLAGYTQKHDNVERLLNELSERALAAQNWWMNEPYSTRILSRIRTFLRNIDNNFGRDASAWCQISSAEHRHKRKQQIKQALLRYHQQRAAWDQLMSGGLFVD